MSSDDRAVERTEQTSAPETVDCLVVGAGLAGLHTAWRLGQRGISCRVLEARGRIGGRIEAVMSPRGEVTALDLGPSWFWPHQRRMRRLLQALGLSWFEQFTLGAALFEQVAGLAPLRSQGAGAPPSYRVAGGMNALMAALAKRLEPDWIRLGHHVRRARYREGTWRLAVETEGGVTEFCAPSLVLALPPRQIIPFLDNEGLPATLSATLARQQTWMSAQAKFVAAFDQPFWRPSGLSGEAFSRVGPMVEVHDASPDDRAFGALFGFIGVPARERLALEPKRLIRQCRQQLEHLFGAGAEAPKFVVLRDWAREPLTVTDADLDEPAAHANFPLQRYERLLAARGLFLAGSEFAAGEPGYLEGALEASEHVLARLGANA